MSLKCTIHERKTQTYKIKNTSSLKNKTSCLTELFTQKTTLTWTTQRSHSHTKANCVHLSLCRWKENKTERAYDTTA